MNTTIPTIDEYLQALSPPDRMALEHIRNLVKQIAPTAEESISYGLPAFKYNGKPLLYFGAFKDHLSVFPTSKPIATLQEKLQDFMQAKGTLHFSADKPIPDDLLKELVLTRIQDIET